MIAVRHDFESPSSPCRPLVCVQKVLGCIKGMQQQWRQLVKVMQAAVAETAGQLQLQLATPSSHTAKSKFDF